MTHRIDFTAPPVCSQFMSSEQFFRLLAGPYGSGKTTTCLMELLRRSCEQWPGPDGIRRTRFAVCRQTLSQLKNTVLKDAVNWFHPIASWKVSESTLHFDFKDVRSEWLLLPLETPEDTRRLLSLQLTGAMLNEAIETDVDLIGPISGRCGRYPGAAEGGCKWYGIVADTNFPAEGTPWHEVMENPPDDMAVFKQPGGLDEAAENLPYLLQTPDTLKLPTNHPERIAQGRLYYARLARDRNKDWVDRYVHAKYAPDPSGAAVFKNSFSRNFHVVPDIEPINATLIVGQDFGRNPVSLLTQMDHRGRILVLQEIWAEDIGLRTQMPNIRAVLYREPFLGKRICFIGDPSGQAKSSFDEITSFDVIRQSGFAIVPAPTNDIDPRITAVEEWLLRQQDGGPAIVFSRRGCPRLIAAMGGGYRYSFTHLDQSKTVPDKNEHSHLADALQYAVLGYASRTALQIARKISRKTNTRPRVTAAGWT
jgi:hypothetical protein